MSGDLLALGAMAGLVVAGAIRRGSGNDQQDLEEWYEDLGLEIVRRFHTLPHVLISGRRAPPLLNTWKAQRVAGALLWASNATPVSFFASPGWEDNWDTLPVQIEVDPAYFDGVLNGFGEIQLRGLLYSGDLKKDAQAYIQVITPLLCFLDTYGFNVEKPEGLVDALGSAGEGGSVTDGYGGKWAGNIVWTELGIQP